MQVDERTWDADFPARASKIIDSPYVGNLRPPVEWQKSNHPPSDLEELNDLEDPFVPVVNSGHALRQLNVLTSHKCPMASSTPAEQVEHGEHGEKESDASDVDDVKATHADKANAAIRAKLVAIQKAELEVIDLLDNIDLESGDVIDGNDDEIGVEVVEVPNPTDSDLDDEAKKIAKLAEITYLKFCRRTQRSATQMNHVIRLQVRSPNLCLSYIRVCLCGCYCYYYLLLLFISFYSNKSELLNAPMQRGSRDDRFMNLSARNMGDQLDGGELYLGDEDTIAVRMVDEDGIEKAWIAKIERCTRLSVGATGKKREENARVLSFTDKNGSMTCSWFVEVLDYFDKDGKVMTSEDIAAIESKGKRKLSSFKSKQRLRKGLRVFSKSSRAPEGFNEKVEMSNVISPVHMKYIEGEHIYVLDASDDEFVENHMASDEVLPSREDFNRRKGKKK